MRRLGADRRAYAGAGCPYQKEPLPCPSPFEEWIRALKTRRLTYTRVSRALLHLILDIQESDICRFKASGYAPYARILGFRKDSGPLLSRLNTPPAFRSLAKLADAGKKLDKNALSMLEQEIRSAHIYQDDPAYKRRNLPKRIYAGRYNFRYWAGVTTV